jgi:hypothetical protein
MLKKFGVRVIHNVRVIYRKIQYCVLIGTAHLISIMSNVFYPEDKDSMSLWNADNHVQYYAEYKKSLPQKLQNFYSSPCIVCVCVCVSLGP